MNDNPIEKPTTSYSRSITSLAYHLIIVTGSFLGNMSSMYGNIEG